MPEFESVNLGFSRKAEVYDDYCENHPVIRWARGLERQSLMRRVRPGASILELNAGTGADAAFFAAQGYRVHATDLADGMIAAIEAKINAARSNDGFTVQQCSFTDLAEVRGGPFEAVFSNFGGLNCIPDLRVVTRQLSRLLKPGGHVVWVVMPPICPWELAQVVRGHWRTAARRLNRDGALANVEGAQVRTFYFRPSQVAGAFDSSFRLLARQSLSLFCPPSYMENFPRRFPGLTRRLMTLDEHFGKRWPFNCWGDFLVFTFQYLPYEGR
ncbi:MAG: class I SAM-dependent methyltransferase [Chloroflexi bacterium]|nr:class I SAM-dependent methyltransferase [Chloroflexota bacterium]